MSNRPGARIAIGEGREAHRRDPDPLNPLLPACGVWLNSMSPPINERGPAAGRGLWEAF